MGTTRQRKPVSLLLIVTMPCAAFLGFQAREACAGKGKTIQEAIEYATGKFAAEVAAESAERLSARLTSLAAKHGDDAIVAFKRVGPQALRVAEEAGEHAGPALRLMAARGQEAMWVLRDAERTALFLRFGDDAAEAMIRHKGIAAPLVRELEGPAARALKAVDSRNARRIKMMADDGDLTRMGQIGRILAVIERYGDGAADFIWRHKGALAVAAVLGAFLDDPKPFIEGTQDLAASAAVPVAEVAKEASRSVNWTAVVMTGMILLTLVFLWRVRAVVGLARVLSPAGSTCRKSPGP
ncbi:MAG TPA: hypothetical protein PKY77_11880 [Phycisphaerae bacterium]|nr:hypothetical protein [Phycisphaerae bacterium]HRY71093.1 hypothetical protein [Phycisphaerae bacterium]